MSTVPSFSGQFLRTAMSSEGLKKVFAERSKFSTGRNGAVMLWH